MNQIIDTSDIKEVRKKIDKLSKEKKKVIVVGRDISFNRLILENKKADILILNHKQQKDRLYQRESGLNHVLCNLARENNTTLAVNLQEFRAEKNKKTLALMLSRLLQNIKLMKKAKNRVTLLNYKNKEQAKSFLLTLGLPTNMIAKAVV
jgi:RNase P/RNase MRP subunit p30